MGKKRKLDICNFVDTPDDDLICVICRAVLCCPWMKRAAAALCSRVAEAEGHRSQPAQEDAAYAEPDEPGGWRSGD
uniref:Ring finger protein 151 n=1 Tax=Cyprinus carpio carpio TaxID=630221 RepID=A0A9J7YQK2_CYPCA